MIVDGRTLTAFHEAGHAVLSAAIASPPEHVTIKANAHTLGRSGARMSPRPTARLQVHLAGFAAEHLLTSRRSRQLDREIGFALLARIEHALGEAFPDSKRCDGYRAVQDVLRIGTYEDDEGIRREVDRYYQIACESLSVVWQSVRAVASALLDREELDAESFSMAIGDADLAPVLRIRRAVTG